MTMTGAAAPTSNAKVDAADAFDEGLAAAVRRRATPVAVVAVVALAAWSVFRAASGAKPGGVGSLLVLAVFVPMALKLAAETYVFSFLGGDPSPRQAIAQRLIGPLAGRTTLRFTLAALGGVIFPLGSQILAAGAKQIQPATDPTVPAVAACLAAACLVPGEILAKRLYRDAVEAA